MTTVNHGDGLIRQCVEFAYGGWPGRMTAARRKMTRELKALRARDPAAFDHVFGRLVNRDG